MKPPDDTPAGHDDEPGHWDDASFVDDEASVRADAPPGAWAGAGEPRGEHGGTAEEAPFVEAGRTVDEEPFAEDGKTVEEEQYAEDDQTFAVMRRKDLVLDERYALLEYIGEGGMGQVWLAHDEWLDDNVAVKLLTRQTRGVVEAHDLLRAEYEAMSLVSHENIVRVFGYGRAEIPDVVRGGMTRAGYYTMQLVPSPRETVEDLLRAGPPGVPTSLGLARGLLEALVALSEQRIVHCDLKPANVFVVDGPTGPRSLLSDLGACRLPDRPRSQIVAGTPSYMAPEQLDELLVPRRPPQITCAADIWAFGALLYELLTGNQLFPMPADATGLSEAARALRGTMVEAYIVPRIGGITDMSARMRELLLTCLRPEPAERATPVALRDQLRPR